MFYVYLGLATSTSISILVLFITFLIYLIKFKENIFDCYWQGPFFETIMVSLLILTVFPFTIYMCCSMLKTDWKTEKQILEKKREKTPWWKLKEFGGKL